MSEKDHQKRLKRQFLDENPDFNPRTLHRRLAQGYRLEELNGSILLVYGEVKSKGKKCHEARQNGLSWREVAWKIYGKDVPTTACDAARRFYGQSE